LGSSFFVWKGRFDLLVFGNLFWNWFCFCILKFYLENLLNSSKSQNETISHPSIQSPHDEQDDDRHERTGSVKFADQAEENKEVNYLFID